MVKINIKRILALVMAALLICALLPFGALASGPNGGEADNRDATSNEETVQITTGDNTIAEPDAEPEEPETEETETEEAEAEETETEEAETEEAETEEPETEEPETEEAETEEAETEETETEEPETEETETEEAEPEEIASMGASQPMVISVPVGGKSVQGLIVVDGDLSDWANVSGYAGGPSRDGLTYDGWKAAMDEAGNLYLCAWGTAISQWASPQWDSLTLTQSGRWDGNMQLGNLQYSGGACAIVNEANGNTPGPFSVEAMVPASFISDPNFTLSFGGDGIPASMIPVVNGEELPPPEETEDPVYAGIAIDGEYHDWDAVAKHPASDPDGWLDSAAMVFDGDWVYIYIKEAPGGDASNAGTHHNGQYAIVTDLGKTMLVQLNSDGTVGGVTGATAAHVGREWEIAIPASLLPEYMESISFGLYQYSPFFVEGVVNLDGSTGGGSFDSEIVYDGNYRDWDYYPHTLIQYATAGTQEHVADAEGAIYADGNTLYGHFYSEMPVHVQGGTYALSRNINIRFNGETWFTPSLFTRNGDGSINWWPDLNITQPGTYEFYLSYTGDYHNAPNLADPRYTGRIDAGPYSNDWCYGRIFITVSQDRIECEFFLDLEVVGERLGMDPSDLKLIEAQFGELGQEWVTTAGSSSGAWLGVGLSVAAVCVVLEWRKKRSGSAVAVTE